MSFREDQKDADRKTVQDIKENVIGLGQQVKDASNEKIHQASDYVHNRADSLKLSGTDALERLESRIMSKPGQSVGIAFAAGIVASYLLRRRS